MSMYGVFYDFFPFLLCVANVLLTSSISKTFVELTLAVVVSWNVNLSVASVLDVYMLGGHALQKECL